MKIQTNTIIKTFISTLLFGLVLAQTAQANNVDIRYKTVEVEGVNVFYREAGNPNNPTILLLHGFPTSSHMFRDLIPQLAQTV